MNWQPHYSEEEIHNHLDGTRTRWVRHWIFGILIWDTYPKGHA